MANLRRNIPNLLSLSRIFLIAPFIVALSQNSTPWLIAISAIMILSDYFDGYLARAWNAVSDAGKVLDPLCDKICTAAVAIALVEIREFPLWLLLAMLVRDLIILIAGLILIKLRRMVPVSDKVGRVTMGVMSICLVVYILNIGLLKSPAVYFTIIMLVVSLLSYGRRFMKDIKGNSS